MKKTFLKIFVALIIILGIIVIFYFNKLNLSISNVDVSSWSFLPILISGALIDSINPCAFSVLLITLAFLIATSAGRMKFLTVGASYIAGIFIVYFLIGLGLLKAMSLIGTPYLFVKFGVGLLILIGVSEILSHFYPNFPLQFALPNFIKAKMANLIKKATYLTVFGLGALVALFEFPCTGGPYFAILSLIQNGGESYSLGLVYLLLYNFIFVLPLIILLFLSGNKVMQEKAEKWKSKAAGKGRIYSGLAMIILAIVILLTL